ncbi:MAG: type IA DNA topoisomerase [Lachnospiraceae bacterium]|nr:type IA DNA topoisomerase [Lachnospiraceae bacterium]
MSKSLFIAEKPSVAQEFAKTLGEAMTRGDGFMESEHAVVTWCVGHLVTMSYPEAYDPALKKWRLDSLPFLPETFRYEVIDAVKKQFGIVKKQLNRDDVSTIYVCTDSGREGEYIYRLVEQMAGVSGKKRRRVWIDSQTEAEIKRGIREAKDLSEYDDLAAAAYLRAKEDYLMGINFSRLLTLKYGRLLAEKLGETHVPLAVGRVMTCVLGMVVRREREIRLFKPTPFYRLCAVLLPGNGEAQLPAFWKVTPDSRHFEKPYLYKDTGFLKEEIAREEAARLMREPPVSAEVRKISRKQEKVNPPLLYNLAELQNTCAKVLHISPDETLAAAQRLYEKKLLTYPRTDARVLSSAIAKEIRSNIEGVGKIADVAAFAAEILENGWQETIGKTKYTNDKLITDHYAIIPTGQGLPELSKLSATDRKVYELVVRRFLAIFYPPAVYRRYELEASVDSEHFFAGLRLLEDPGFMKVSGKYGEKKQEDGEDAPEEATPQLAEALERVKKGSRLPVERIDVKEGETSPPKRYNSGSLILAMENAGQLIEDEELRAQIRGSGIGTSATRAEILKKLVSTRALALAKKTQIVTPTLRGEMIFDTVDCSIRSLLNPELTASWEMGLTKVAEGALTSAEYMAKLEDFIRRRTQKVKESDYADYLSRVYERDAAWYRKSAASKKQD